MVEAFFDKISEFYDDMIGFDGALDRRTSALQKFITPEMQYAADIGCGTGLDSISLTRHNLKVRAFDPSEGMIEQAKLNAEKYGGKIKFYNSGLSDIPELFNSSFDLAVSLGNTIANIPREKIDISIKKLYDLLKPGGKTLLQILNYERLKKSNDRIVNITRHDVFYYVRFYDFLGSYINFNILKFNSTNPKDRVMETNPLFPYSSEEISGVLKLNGFTNIEIFGNFNREEYKKDTSPDLIISAVK